MFFKFSISFILSYFILSMNVSNRPLFYHLNAITGPVGNDIQKSISKSFKNSVKKTKEIGQQFINSSIPKYLDDSIKSKQSAVKKEHIQKKNFHFIREDLRTDEKITLDKIIEKD